MKDILQNLIQRVEENRKRTEQAMATLSTSSSVCLGCSNQYIECILINPITGKAYVKKINCKCAELQAQREKQACEQWQKKQRIEQVFANAGLTKRLKNCTFENFIQNEKTSQVYDACLDYAENFEDRDKNRRNGLLLSGSYGVGKSHLAAAVVNYLLVKGYSCVFKPTPNLFRELRDSFNNRTTGQYINGLINCDLLVLDDLGAEMLKDWVEEQFYIVINSRYSQMLPIIYTSNCTGKELEQRLKGRSMSRILGSSEIVKIDGVADNRISDLVPKIKDAKEA